jgi:hypothetical protein
MIGRTTHERILLGVLKHLRSDSQVTANVPPERINFAEREPFTMERLREMQELLGPMPPDPFAATWREPFAPVWYQPPEREQDPPWIKLYAMSAPLQVMNPRMIFMGVDVGSDDRTVLSMWPSTPRAEAAKRLWLKKPRDRRRVKRVLRIVREEIARVHRWSTMS